MKHGFSSRIPLAHDRRAAVLSPIALGVLMMFAAPAAMAQSGASPAQLRGVQTDGAVRVDESGRPAHNADSGLAGRDAGQQAATLPDITVSGGPRSDLRADKARVQVGPLGERDAVDTPYAVTGLPGAQLADQQILSVRDALRTLPWVQADTARPQTRGVQGSVIQNSRADGFNIVSTTEYPMEQFDHLEVLNGVAGSLYGPATGSGIFNFVQKRAGVTGTNTLRLGINDSGALSAHADLWTPIDSEKRWRVRANLLQDIGESFVRGSHLRRSLAAVALDGDLTPSTRLQVNASRYEHVQRGLPGSFGVAAGVNFPAPVDATRKGYGQEYAGNKNDTNTVTARVLHRLDNGWELEGGLSRQIADRESTAVSNTVLSAAGNYRTTSSSTTASRFTVTGNQLSLRGKAQTGSIGHDIVVANNGFDWNNYNPVGGSSLTLGTGSITSPVAYARPNYPDFTRRYQSAAQRQQSLIVADTLSLTEQWQLMLSGAYSWMHLTNYNRAGVTTRKSSESGLSTFAGLLYKPTPNSSVYLSHADTLQPGDAAPTGTANEGEVLDPYRSKQWELGYKVRLAEVDVTAAVFRIERPFGYTDSAVQIDGKPLYHRAGKQRNHGAEFSVTGNVGRDLTLTAGLAWLDPRMISTASAASRDKRIVGLSRWSAGLGADLRIAAVPGLSANLQFNAVDRRPANYANTDWIGGYGRTDVGVRYQHTLLQHDAVWRFTVYNVTNQRYWTNVVAGGLNGYSGAGNASAAVGDPRTMLLTLTLGF